MTAPNWIVVERSGRALLDTIADGSGAVTYYGLVTPICAPSGSRSTLQSERPAGAADEIEGFHCDMLRPIILAAASQHT